MDWAANVWIKNGNTINTLQQLFHTFLALFLKSMSQNVSTYLAREIKKKITKRNSKEKILALVTEGSSSTLAHLFSHHSISQCPFSFSSCCALLQNLGEKSWNWWAKAPYQHHQLIVHNKQLNTDKSSQESRALIITNCQHWEFCPRNSQNAHSLALLATQPQSLLIMKAQRKGKKSLTVTTGDLPTISDPI